MYDKSKFVDLTTENFEAMRQKINDLQDMIRELSNAHDSLTVEYEALRRAHIDLERKAKLLESQNSFLHKRIHDIKTTIEGIPVSEFRRPNNNEFCLVILNGEIIPTIHCYCFDRDEWICHSGRVRTAEEIDSWIPLSLFSKYSLP